MKTVTVKRAQLEQWLETLEQWNTPLYKRGTAITAIKAALEAHKALAQPDQETVFYSGNGTAGQEADVRPTGFFFQMTTQSKELEQEPVAKYSDIVSDGGLDQRNTAPPQRTWVWLTDEEVEAIYRAVDGNEFPIDFYKEIEAKLKEKNA